ncbi:3-phenylpropionate/cinnamic acid dioxygenase small subunit [Streptosporangium becharense]|uniref:3-phenylpropionate/cinnamic acid dioxygenase small subunit n=1 Tax=Streptosporangium becharense TaxID=1816182 RepID=A0A7W9IMR4_9ACTN|nr:nuclear transport factor 2 family protein [Streptosporangium becharense]MBB2914374.1 3-phenylpropionate/cinnamic acid dioxygenase small subunit [Streptosporangium becharense]MBB5823594.1 3-phenylpropionate/cinnamic acid dioxygenase small subunit [Streptosporangium becharense]
MSPRETPQTIGIVNTLHAFARLADEGTLHDLAALLADDVQWTMAGTHWRGREQTVIGLGRMRELGHAGPDSGNRHVITNLEVHTTGDRATAFSYFLLVSSTSPAAILAVGSYHDELSRVQDGRWILTRREVTT